MYAVSGMRLGTVLHTPLGMVKNGEIEERHKSALLTAGYKLVWSDGIPERLPTQEEREAMAQAETMRGSLQRDIDKKMADVLAPLRKKSYKLF